MCPLVDVGEVCAEIAAKHPEAGVTDRLFDVADIVKLLDEPESKKSRVAEGGL